MCKKITFFLNISLYNIREITLFFVSMKISKILNSKTLHNERKLAMIQIIYIKKQSEKKNFGTHKRKL